MALDEVGYNSQDLAREIRRQLNRPTGYIDIDAVACSLDIVEIKREPVTTFEGALLTDAERSWGSILINASGGRLRGRFTLAHELLHFLNDRHVQTEDGFRCRVRDIRPGPGLPTPGMSRHLRQELEANRFAIDLLAPKGDFSPMVDEAPDLAHVHTIAARLELSKEATARRYRELHEARMALVFHANGTVRYVDRPVKFTDLSLRKHSPIPSSVETGLSPGIVTEVETADPKDWFHAPPMADLSIQTLYQNKGYAITMLTLDDKGPDNDGLEDSVDRFSR